MDAEALVQTEKGRRDAYRIATGTARSVRKLLDEVRFEPLVANRLLLAANGLERLVELLELPEAPA